MGGEIINGFMRHITTAITSAMGEVVVLIARALNHIPGVNIDISDLRRRVAAANQTAQHTAEDPEGALRAASGASGAPGGVSAMAPETPRRARHRRAFAAALQAYQKGGGHGMPPVPEGTSDAGARAGHAVARHSTGEDAAAPRSATLRALRMPWPPPPGAALIIIG